MKKDFIKLFFIIFIIIVFLNLFALQSYAVDTSAYSDITTISGSDMGSFKSFGGQILYVVQFVGYSVAVIMLAVMGIQYIISSPSQKADLKTRFVPYIIGAVLLFSGSTILSIIYTIVTKR